MAFQKKYYYTFRDINNSQYTVELWQNTGTTITAQEVRADETPFVVTYPTTTNKFDTILGSGCDFNLLSLTGMSFFNLYTVDMQECQIKLYNSGSSLVWIGYMNSELYTEPFAEYNNYPVNITGNDGFALLERLDYLQASGNNYTGFTNNWTAITNILGKLGIYWNKIYVGLSTTSSELTIGSSDTILSQTYSYNSNYYDEDSKPMNCKEVLETILKPFSANIQQINGSLYITDIHNLATAGTSTFRRYNGTSFAYESNVSINLSLGDVSDIGFVSNNQTLNVLSPINKQKIIFSPYITGTLLDYVATDDVYVSGVSHSYGSFPTTWVESGYSYSNSWDKYNPTDLSKGSSRFSMLYGTGTNVGTTDKYLTIGSGSTASVYSSFSYKGKLPDMLLNANSLYYLKIEADCFVRTTDELGAIGTLKSTSCNIYTNLIIGNKKFRYNSTNSTKEWIDATITGATFPFYFISVASNNTGAITNDSYGNISDSWTNLMEEGYSWPDKPFYVPLNSSSVGNTVYFDIYNYAVYDNTQSVIANRTITSSVKDVRIKNIKFTIVDSNQNDVSNNDIEYWSYINKNVKDDGSDITLKLGTNTTYVPIEKGSILGFSGGAYFQVQSFTRGGTTGIVENLLAKSITSNYTPKTLEVQCSINKIPSTFGVLTYNNYLTGNFGIQGAVIDYSESTIDLTLQQINVDDPTLVIKKNY